MKLFTKDTYSEAPVSCRQLSPRFLVISVEKISGDVVTWRSTPKSTRESDRTRVGSAQPLLRLAATEHVMSECARQSPAVIFHSCSLFCEIKSLLSVVEFILGLAGGFAP